jgi:hypothetical protein
VLGQTQQEPPKGKQGHSAEESLRYQSSHGACFTIRRCPQTQLRRSGSDGIRADRYVAAHTTYGLRVIACPEPSTPVTCATNRQADVDTGIDERSETLVLRPPVVVTVAPPPRMAVWEGHDVVAVKTDPTAGFEPVWMSAPETT